MRSKCRVLRLLIKAITHITGHPNKILHFHGPKPTFSEEDYSKFPFKNLITPFFHEMKEKFNETYDNYSLLNT